MLIRISRPLLEISQRKFRVGCDKRPDGKLCREQTSELPQSRQRSLRLLKPVHRDIINHWPSREAPQRIVWGTSVPVLSGFHKDLRRADKIIRQMFGEDANHMLYACL